ncbi:MAG: EamA family transporter [Candidatus Delongbacteria bacterium]|nr:EamA family transporter [Candidatus Delongbacteria bacterium]MBN2835813.1 EamA family transporter [Candidatus Delongbacteria bacterium]
MFLFFGAMKRDDYRIYLVITVLLWASAFVGIRDVVKYIDAGPMALLRFIVVSIVLFMFYILSSTKRIPEKKDLKYFLFSGFSGFFLYNLTLNWGEQLVNAATASFLVSSLTIFTGVISAVVFKEKLGVRSWIGIVVSFFGIGIISFYEGEKASMNYGVILVLVSAISSSVYTIVQKKLVTKYGSLNTLVWSVWFGTIFMTLYFPELVVQFSQLSNSKISIIVYLGIFPGAIAYFTWNKALSLIDSATRATTALYFTPIVVTILGWFLLDESISFGVFLGGVLVLFGVYLSQKRRRNGQ